MCFYIYCFIVSVYCRLDLQYLFDWFCSLNVSLLDMVLFTFSGFLLTRPFFLSPYFATDISTLATFPVELSENKGLSTNKIKTYSNNLR